MPSRDSSRFYKLFLDAVDLPPGTRSAFLIRECGGDTELRASLQSLIDADREAPAIDGWIERQSITGRWDVDRLQTEPPLSLPPDELLGPYRVLRMLGRGGMGAVYLAKRADGHDEQLVALKLIGEAGMRFELRARFLRERQVLATLDHPGIARLLDAGVTSHDQPYLVLEYVEGVPIDRFCEERQLGIRERLRLFLQVCAAVQEAHRKLVIHRDIKPANILVTPSGQPKLLDFGIAKILDEGPPGASVSGRTALLFTPNYASPEQMRGEAMGVQADVYSLGVLLYQLLSGVLPLATENAPLLEAARLVQEQDPPPPSAAAIDPQGRSALRGDLDTINLYALQKDPERRYSSVESFAADIERYLEGFPVQARGNTFTYRLTKFLRRRRGWVAVGAAALVLIIASVDSIIRSARVAEQQRALAERRFTDLRELARSYLFEIDSQLEAIPGTTKVRELMNTRAVSYLDRLGAESGNDTVLQREVATGYTKLATVQGVAFYANLGDRSGAKVSIEKALRLRRAILLVKPDSVEDHLLYARSLLLKGHLDLNWGDPAAAAAVHREALNETEWVLAKNPKPTGRELNTAGSAALYLAMDLGPAGVGPHLGDPVAALPVLLRDKELVEREGQVRAQMPPSTANNAYRYSNQAVAEISIARLYRTGLEQPELALQHLDRALQLLHTPGVDLSNAEIRRKLTTLWLDYGSLLLERGQVAGALRFLRDSREQTRRVLLEDPANLAAQLDDAFAEFYAGRAAAATGNVAGGFAGINESLRKQRQLAANDPGDAMRATGLVTSLYLAGDSALACGRVTDALGYYTESSRRAQAAIASHPTDARARLDLSRAEHGLARYFAGQSQPEAAGQHNALAGAAARAVLNNHPDNPNARRLLAEAGG